MLTTPARILPWMLLALAAQGCVSKAKFDDLKQTHDAAQQDLTERAQTIESLQSEVESLEARNEDLQAKLESLETEMAQLQKRHAAAEAEQERLYTELAASLTDRARLEESAEQLGHALRELARRKGDADRRVAEYRDLLVRFKKLIDAGTLRVTMSDGRMVLQLPTDILFDSGSAQLSQQGREAIVQVSTVLKDITDRRFQIEGHTDNVPIRNDRFRSNWELASARALGVVRAMTESGMDGALLSGASFGEHRPTADNGTDDGRRENRRIEIVLVPDLSLLPGYEEIKQVVSNR